MKSFAHHYSSDISREQFELIRTDLEGIRKRTKNVFGYFDIRFDFS
ncbi:hypothetical protein ACTEZU_14925 (plasmid) [Lactiplantibacillus plantarum]